MDVMKEERGEIRKERIEGRKGGRKKKYMPRTGLVPFLLVDRFQISHAAHAASRRASVFQDHVTRRSSNTTVACISLLHHKAFYVVTNSLKNK
jgi:hypothetical protein